tara:strand:+ start:2803 stop:3159 length:357 start_codon:yes stop_codon:yes gene_type:complete
VNRPTSGEYAVTWTFYVQADHPFAAAFQAIEAFTDEDELANRVVNVEPTDDADDRSWRIDAGFNETADWKMHSAGVLEDPSNYSVKEVRGQTWEEWEHETDKEESDDFDDDDEDIWRD